MWISEVEANEPPSVAQRPPENGLNALLLYQFNPWLQSWYEQCRPSVPGPQCVSIGSLYAEEEVVVVDNDVVPENDPY